MECGAVLDALVDGDRGVDYGGLDYLALDHGLDNFVYVMVDMFTSNGAGGYLDLLGRKGGGSGLEVEGLLLKLPSNCSLILRMSHLPMLNRQYLSGMSLLSDYLILDRLDTGLIVVLVDLTIDGNGFFDALDGSNDLLGNGRFEDLTDFSIVLVVALELGGEGDVGGFDITNRFGVGSGGNVGSVGFVGSVSFVCRVYGRGGRGG